MKTVNFKFLLMLLATIGLLAACTPSSKKPIAQATEQAPLKIGYLPLTHALPLLGANELPDSVRAFKKLELVKFGSWPELVEALNAGKLDGASILVELALKAKQEGFPLKAVALGHRDGNVVVVSPDIKEPKDLIGKTIAIPHRLSSHNVLLQITLKKAGIDLSKVNITELPPPEMPAALAEKRISAYVVAEPFGAKSVVAGIGKVLHQSGDLWENSICCALVLRDSVIINKHHEVAAFVNDYLTAADRLDKQKGTIDPFIKKYIKAEDAVLQQSLQWISFHHLAIENGDYDQLVSLLKEFNINPTPPQYSDFIDNTYTTQYYKKQ